MFFLSIYSAAAFYVTANKPTQSFLGFGIYSSQGNLSGYTGLGSTVNVNQTYHWNLNVTNEMGTTQLVAMIARLGNNLTIGPNPTSPATLQVLANFTAFVSNKKSILQSFNWTVTNMTSSAGLDSLTLDINGRRASPSLGTFAGYPFRLYFELWTFNTPLSKFQYYTWLQIGFTVTS